MGPASRTQLFSLALACSMDSVFLAIVIWMRCPHYFWTFEYLALHWWHSLGMLKMNDLAGQTLEFQKQCVIPSLCSASVCGLRYKLSAVSAAMTACCQTSPQPRWWQTFIPLALQTPNKPFILKAALVMMIYHNKKKVTNMPGKEVTS